MHTLGVFALRLWVSMRVRLDVLALAYVFLRLLASVRVLEGVYVQSGVCIHVNVLACFCVCVYMRLHICFCMCGGLHVFVWIHLGKAVCIWVHVSVR